MKKSKYTESQIANILRQAANGTPAAELCRKFGISEATFYVWKKRYGNMGTPEISEVRQLRDENSRLKKLVADLSLDRQILQEVVTKNGKEGSAVGCRAVDCRTVASKHSTDLPYT